MGNTTEIQVTHQSMDPLCKQFLVRLLLLLESLQHAALSFHLTQIYSPLELSCRYQIAWTSHAERSGLYQTWCYTFQYKEHCVLDTAIHDVAVQHEYILIIKPTRCANFSNLFLE